MLFEVWFRRTPETLDFKEGDCIWVENDLFCKILEIDEVSKQQDRVLVVANEANNPLTVNWPHIDGFSDIMEMNITGGGWQLQLDKWEEYRLK